MLLRMVKDMNRLRLDSVEWGEFYLGGDKGLFKVGGTQTTHPSELVGNGNIPRITCSATNNGLEDFYKNRPTEKGGVLTVDSATIGYVSYQGSDFITTDHVEKIFLPNDKKINKFLGLFLKTSIDKSKGDKYGYGYKFSQSRIRKQKILLPIDNLGNPNWRFMEDYTKQEMKSQAEKIVDYYEQKLINEANILLDLEEIKWNLFQIDKIFDVKRVEGKPINNYENGNIPYVTTSSENNGITNFVNAIESDISKRSAISVDPVGGTTFYHDYDFVGRGFSGSSINLLYNDNLNSLNSKFVCSAIEKVSKVKASYGLHFNGNRLRSAKILLPSEENGNPNWQYMTDFIKSLEHETASKALEYIYIYIS